MSALCSTSGADDCCLGGRKGRFGDSSCSNLKDDRLLPGVRKSLLLLLLLFCFCAQATPPQITQQPQGRAVVEGGSNVFAVSVSGTAPLAFQWRKDDTELSNRTNATLSLTLIQTNDAGLYTVVITNLEGAVTSSPARLAVRLA